MAATYNFQIEQGATFVRPVAWKNSAGVPIDLTGYTARMHIRATALAPDTLLVLTSQNGKLVIDAINGTVTISLSTGTTTDMYWRRAVYDLELVAPGGVVTRLIEGAITVSSEVTR